MRAWSLSLTLKLQVSYQGNALLLCLSGVMVWSWVIKVSFVPNSLFILLSTALDYSTAEGFEDRQSCKTISASFPLSEQEQRLLRWHEAFCNSKCCKAFNDQFKVCWFSSDLEKENWFQSRKKDNAVCVHVLHCHYKIGLHQHSGNVILVFTASTALSMHCGIYIAKERI